MRYLRSLFIPAALCAASCNAVNLYVATSDGNLTTLSLAQSTDAYKLNVSSVTKDCGPNASWLTLDSPNRILFCLDRGATSSTKGSMNSFTVGDAGKLSINNRVEVPPSGVHAEIFGTKETKRGIISASFNKSAIAVMAIDSEGVTGQLSAPLEELAPTIAKPGPVASRQDVSYLHQVLLDPEKKHIFVSELGGDLFRVFNWSSTELAPITELPSLETESGAGPRHGVFWTSPAGELLFFFVGELDQKVYSYKIDNTGAEVTWTKVFEIPALGEENAKPATTAPTSGIALTPDNKFLIVSNRDISFRGSTQFRSGPSDTLSTFAINEDGTLSLVQLAPSGGYSPRQFSINKAGDLVAVGHQSNRTVVIWKRDLESGKIVPEAEGGLAATVTLTGAVVCTIWDE